MSKQKEVGRKEGRRGGKREREIKRKKYHESKRDIEKDKVKRKEG